ncbi:SGNH/GDSL hydrolase family protein [Nocardia sp. NBC_01009]|uniref:SGNH/GDSL hydrolase family protein n=1 Tax=Nocardia sp. NBC_01009 TaxID=2975996 RepID=UPI003870ED72|nr:SGNH/GDSL hydrolase family protein [Nocardia sp. NBC_01009]
MEHLEAHNPQLVNQADLPAVGSMIEVLSWRNRGYVHAMMTSLRARFPWVEFDSSNYGEGGANSTQVLDNINAVEVAQTWDLAMFGCGINDVWREFQGRLTEAVDFESYDKNIRAALDILRAFPAVVVIGEPPIGWDPQIDAAAANRELARYNQRAQRAATDADVPFISLWERFIYAGACMGWSVANPAAPALGKDTLWSDGVHLSELGDQLVRDEIEHHLTERRSISRLLT